MNPICSFRIPTQDLGLGNYNTIPLDGKASYKVANHSNNRSRCFSIIAYTWDTLANKVISNNAPEDLIDLALNNHGDIKVSSATGEGYVNIKPFVAKEGNSVTSKVGFGKTGWMGGIMTGVKAFQAVYKLLQSVGPEENPKCFQFSITAHRTSETKLTFSGEITLKDLSQKLRAEKAWGDGTTLSEMGQVACDKLSAYGDLKEFGKLLWG